MSNNLMNLTHKLLKKIVYPQPLEIDISSNIIRDELEKNKPSMIARFGSTEIKAVIFPYLPFLIRPFLKKIVLNTMNTNAGFFPSNSDSIKKFSKLMIEDMKLLDVLGCWRLEERF